jgi:2-dehydropantoate 2-reductase
MSDAPPSTRPSMPLPGGPRILVVGCGGIGGIATACLAEAGQDVTASTTNDAIFEAVQARGLEVLAEGGAVRQVRAKVVHGIPQDRGMFDVVVLATQPPQVEEAARSVLPVLAEDGAVLVLQNGLCEERVASIVGEPRVVGAVVGWGATMPEPGVYERTAPGGFTLGMLSGEPIPSRHDRFVQALEAIGPVETTSNLRGKRWSKLAINSAISTLGTLGGERLGALMPHRFVRRLALEIFSEVTAVARAERVTLEKVSGTIDLDWISLTSEERLMAGSPSLVAKHALLLAVGLRFRRMRSSMLSAIERGRTPAVDFLNGEVVTRAERHGISVPVNAKARELVWALSEKKRTSGLSLLRELYDATGPHGA